MIWKYNWKFWLSETLLKIMSTSLVESKWAWGRQNEKRCRSFIVYRLLETDIGSWVTSKLESGSLDQPSSIKSFASPRFALDSLPSCAVTEWIAVGVEAELHLKIFSVENEPLELIQVYRDHRPRHFWKTKWLCLSNWKASQQKQNSTRNSWTLKTHKGRHCWKIMTSGKHVTSKFQVRVT